MENEKTRASCGASDFETEGTTEDRSPVIHSRSLTTHDRLTRHTTPRRHNTTIHPQSISILVVPPNRLRQTPHTYTAIDSGAPALSSRQTCVATGCRVQGRLLSTWSVPTRPGAPTQLSTGSVTTRQAAHARMCVPRAPCRRPQSLRKQKSPPRPALRTQRAHARACEGGHGATSIIAAPRQQAHRLRARLKPRESTAAIFKATKTSRTERASAATKARRRWA